MPYADIEMKVAELLGDALPDDVTIRRGRHAPDAMQSVSVKPGSADRQAQGSQGRVSHWQVLIEMRVSSGLDLSDWHNDVLGIREQVIDTLDKYPTLDGMRDVTGSIVATLDEPSTETEGRLYTWKQVARVEVTEYATVRGGEYA